MLKGLFLIILIVALGAALLPLAMSFGRRIKTEVVKIWNEGGE